MRKLRDVMQPGFLVTVLPSARVTEAVEAMIARNVGIVAVMEGDRLAGVFSERDLARRVIGRGLDPSETRVDSVMTSKLVVADADEPYDQAMEQMDQANIRHLPVFSAGRMVSMVSIRDLLRAALHEKHAELRDLHAYISHVPMAPVQSG